MSVMRYFNSDPSVLTLFVYPIPEESLLNCYNS